MTTTAIPQAYQPLAADQRVAVAPERPWMPNQILAASFLFGSAAGGVLAAINARRVGGAAALYLVLGLAIFALQVGVALFAVPAENMRMVGLMFNVACGLLLSRMQKPAFEAWKSAHWRPASEGERYRPSNIGQLFLAGILTLAAEAGAIAALLFALGETF